MTPSNPIFTYPTITCVDNGYFLPLKRKSIRLSEVHLHPLVYIGLAGCLDLISEFRD